MRLPVLKTTDMHVGKLIKDTVSTKGMTIVSFAQELSCTRANVYKIFNKSSIDTGLLARICRILNHDFFKDLSESL